MSAEAPPVDPGPPGSAVMGHRMASQQADQYALLKRIGLIKTVDFYLAALVVFSTGGGAALCLLRPDLWAVSAALAVLAAVVLQLWILAVLYRVGWILVKVWHDQSLMTVEAARIAVKMLRSAPGA